MSWLGLFCNVYDYCYSLLCGEYGMCQNKFNLYYCFCDLQWLGENCLINVCENIICSYKGNCLVLNLIYYCECKNGWVGKDCGVLDLC